MPQDDANTTKALNDAQAHISEGKFEAAQEILASILQKAPEHVAALYTSAVCRRYENRPRDAFALIGKIKELAPEYGSALQEEGHLYREAGELDKALSAYRNACLANPALEASWRMQAEILSNRGRHDEAAELRSQSERLRALPKELFVVTNFIHENKLAKAEQLCRQFLQTNKHHVEAMRLLAEIASRYNILDEAEFLLESAVEFAPENIQLRLDYIQVLRKRQKLSEALEQAKHLYDENPDVPHFQSGYAIESLQAGDFENALALFDRVLEKLPNDPNTLTSRGHALKTYGRQEEAISSYRAAITAKPDHGDAYYSLGNLKTYRFTDNELAAMEKEEACDNLSNRDRIFFCFALGKAFEDHGDYEKSFSFYTRGNNLKRMQSRYVDEHMAAELEVQARVCSRALFDKQEGRGCPAPDPIFIVGLPRAGSTLLEQILASHSQVDGTSELPHILALAQKLRGRKPAGDETAYPNNLFDLSSEQLVQFGQDYIDNTRVHRKNAPYFTDKMPNNFRHIGLIHMIFPNAKIIDARREPMACCFSGFKQLFADGQEFTYGLEQVGRYYQSYVKLMRHWEEVLPGRVLHVQYEDMVADLEPQVRRILDYCGLPFEQACVDFHKTEREVRTASSEQVRQPINKKGLEQWRPFEPYLGVLKDALGESLKNYRAM